MSFFICPICGNALQRAQNSLHCEKNHCFDLAKSGYVNLLLSQKSKDKRHGDDKLMVRARQDFLDKGYYYVLLQNVCERIESYARDGAHLLDCGCGECWYTAKVCEYLAAKGIAVRAAGVDISKDALAIGAKRNPDIELAVASAFHLPVRSHSCDLLLNFFAPCSAGEYARVLKAGGILIRAIPLERHLWELKEAVYEQPYVNEVEEPALEGFTLLDRGEIRERLHLDTREDIANLFAMTPYYYKTSAADQQKAAALQSLDTRIEFAVLVYRQTAKA